MEWVSLIFGFLGPLLAQCHQKTSTEDPRQFLKDHYDPATKDFSGGIVQEALPQTYRAIRQARRHTPFNKRKDFPTYSRDEVVQLTKDHFIQSMGADDATLKLTLTAAAALPDSDL